MTSHIIHHTSYIIHHTSYITHKRPSLMWAFVRYMRWDLVFMATISVVSIGCMVHVSSSVSGRCHPSLMVASTKLNNRKENHEETYSGLGNFFFFFFFFTKASVLTSYIIHHTSYIIHHTSYIIHHTSYIIHHTSYIIHHTR